MRRLAWAAASLMVAACGGPGNVPPAQGAAIVQLGPGADAGQNDASACRVPSSSFAIPAEDRFPGGILPTAVDDGAADEPGTAHVRCRVRPDGDAYDVDLSIARDDGSSAAITGTMSRASSQVQASVSAGGAGATFAAQGPCTIDFTAAEGMDIQPGRVWAVMTCPRATDGQGHTCQASAEILFDDCEP